MRFISKFTRIQFFVLLFQKLLKVAFYKWKNGETGGLGAAKTPPRMREARTSSLSAGVRKAGRPRPLVVGTGYSCSPEAWALPYGRAVTLTSHLRGTKALGAFQRFESLFSDPNPIIGLHLISIQCLLSPTQVGTSPSSQTGKVKKILNI